MADTIITQPSTLDISTASIRITMQFVRPSTDVEWQDSTAFDEWVINKCNSVGERWNEVTISEDGLTLTSVTYWLDWYVWMHGNVTDWQHMQHFLVDMPAHTLATNITKPLHTKEWKLNGEWARMPDMPQENRELMMLRLQHLKDGHPI